MLTDEQLAIRRTGITATDIPAILGKSPWKSPLGVYLDKIGEAPAFVGNDDTDRGTFLEAGVREWAAKKLGKHITPGGTFVSPFNSLLIATPDGYVSERPGEDPEALLEIKCPRRSTGWGEPGTDEVPDHILLQGHWQMGVIGLPRVIFAPLIGGELPFYPVDRDPDLNGQLVEAAERFWRDHVVPKKPPQASGPDLPWLKERFPAEAREHVVAQDAWPLLTAYLASKALAESAKATEESARAALQAALGDAAGVRWGGGRIDWKRNKPSTVTDWKAVVADLRASLQLRASVGAKESAELLAELDAIGARFTTERAGARPFKLFLKGED